MDFAEALRLYEQEVNQVESALESFFSYIDLIDDPDDTDFMFSFDYATEAKSKKGEPESTALVPAKGKQAPARVMTSKDEGNANKEAKKEFGLSATLKTIWEAIKHFFANLFGKNTTVVEAPKWPSSADSPDYIMGKIDKNFDEIMNAINRNMDPSTVKRMINEFQKETADLLDDVDKQIKDTKHAALRSSTTGKKFNILNVFGKEKHAQKKLRGLKVDQLKLAEDLIKVRNNQAIKLAKLVDSCMIDGKGTGVIADQANKVDGKQDRKVRRFERKRVKYDNKEAKWKNSEEEAVNRRVARQEAKAAKRNK